MVIHLPHEIPDKHHMVGPNGFSEQGHVCFPRSSVALLVVAPNACAHKIFPNVRTTPCPRDDMIHGQRDIGPAAVLTAVTVSPEDVLS